MVELKRYNVGFGEIENFDIELNSKFRSIYYQDKVREFGSQSKIVEEAMKIKIRDEEKYLLELYRNREEIRQDLARVYTKNSRTYRRILKQLRIEADKTTQEYKKKYSVKIEHLRKKYREDEKEKLKKLPKGLEDYAMLRVFDQEKFDEIVAESYEVLVIGDLKIDEDEVIEAVANNSKDAHELISTEDLLAKTKLFNKKARARMMKWEKDRIKKLRCRTCKHEKRQLDELSVGDEREGDAEADGDLSLAAPSLVADTAPSQMMSTAMSKVKETALSTGMGLMKNTDLSQAADTVTTDTGGEETTGVDVIPASSEISSHPCIAAPVPASREISPSPCTDLSCKRPKRLYPIFKQQEEPVRTIRLEEPTQPVGRTRSPPSLKDMCEEHLKITSRMVKSLKEICSEKIRDILCEKVDTQETKELLKVDCKECGPGLFDEDRESYIIGSDVVALFPSIKSRTTGLIIRRRVERTTLQFPGFNYRQGARYIVMNRHYTGDLQGLANILPRRRKTQGVTPGMTRKAMND